MASAVALLLALGAGGWLFARWAAEHQPRIAGLDELSPACPSHLYGDPERIVPGQRLSAEVLEGLLHDAGYRPVESAELPMGTYRVLTNAAAPSGTSGIRFDIHLRGFPVQLPGGFDGHGMARVLLAGGSSQERVHELVWRGRAWNRPLPLDPPRLASYYDESLRECRPVPLHGLPEHLLEAVMAAEDDEFLEHEGLSLLGMARAALVNFRAGEVRQGGSTITQQLMKNLYLDASRTYERKLREAGLALLADRRYSKEEILEAYLNWIYWGRSGSVQLIGIAAAAEAYFGRQPEELDLAQSAVLAGMIRSPGHYNPTWNAEGALERRNFVLHRMANLGWIEADELASALRSPLDVRPQPFVPNRVGPAARFVEREAEKRFGIRLAASGYRLLSTLNLREQQAAQEAVREHLEEFAPGSDLEAALVSIRPVDGAVLAYVGGRDGRASGFDRARQARRQVGSLYKPFVYAAAFDSGLLPSDLVHDAPLTLQVGDETWSPRNHTREYEGPVTVRQAVEKSLNTPAVRVALATGLGKVARTAGALGVAPQGTYPSLALGASTFTPLEMAGAFAVLAAEGVRADLHTLQHVLDAAGSSVPAKQTLRAQRVVEPTSVRLVNSVLRGVVDRGTAWRLRALGLEDPLAGKTGTSNDGRDTWFAGYSPDRATVVWVGYDDNRPTGSVGGRAALPVFARFAAAVRPPAGFQPFEEEAEGLVWVDIDPTTGYLAGEHCPRSLREVFPVDREPKDSCPEHGPRARQQERWEAMLLAFGIAPTTATPGPEILSAPSEAGRSVALSLSEDADTPALELAAERAGTGRW